MHLLGQRSQTSFWMLTPARRVLGHGILVHLDFVLPCADDGKIGARNGRHAIIRAGGALDFELVREWRTMHLVLIGHGQVVAQLHRVIAGPFAAGHADAAGRRAERRSGTAQIEPGMRQLLECRFEFSGAGAQQNEVAGRPMHIGKPRAVTLPYVADGAKRVAGVKPTGWLVDAYGVEVGDIGKLLPDIAVTPNDSTAIAEHADQAAVFPMPFLLLVGKLQLAKEILGAGAGLASRLDFLDEAGPGTFFEFVEQFGLLAGRRASGASLALPRTAERCWAPCQLDTIYTR